MISLNWNSSLIKRFSFSLNSCLRKRSDFHFRLIKFYFQLIQFYFKLIDFNFGFRAVHFCFGKIHSLIGEIEFLQINTAFLTRFCGFLPLRFGYIKILQKALRKNCNIEMIGFTLLAPLGKHAQWTRSVERNNQCNNQRVVLFFQQRERKLPLEFYLVSMPTRLRRGSGVETEF